MKRFPSPGYKVWEDCRKQKLSVGMKLGWLEEKVMKLLTTKKCEWALNAVSDTQRDERGSERFV